MGFIYTTNPQTGRQVMACDFCLATPARKLRCPYNYCQAWATCATCRRAGKHKRSSAGRGTHHEYCKPAQAESAERARLRAAEPPENLVTAAWGSWATGHPETTLVVTATNTYHLVKGYNGAGTWPVNKLDGFERVADLTNDQAQAMLTAAYKTCDNELKEAT